MKVLAGLISFCAANAISNKSADFECLMNCYREVFQEVIKCETNDDYTEEDVGICADNAFLNFWHVCLGDTCGATLPEGVCADECIPALEEEVAKCDGLIELFIVNFGKQIII